MRSEREWWGRFEDVGGRRTKRVVLDGLDEAATFRAADIDFVEILAHEGTPQIVVISARQVMQLEADWLVLQPELVRKNPGKGWQAVGGRFDELQFLGSEELTAIQFREDEDTTICRLRSFGPDAIEIVNLSEKSLELLAFPPA
jgi:hypothetical protein